VLTLARKGGKCKLKQYIAFHNYQANNPGPSKFYGGMLRNYLCTKKILSNLRSKLAVPVQFQGAYLLHP
jgi:hypothetical protein